MRSLVEWLSATELTEEQSRVVKLLMRLAKSKDPEDAAGILSTRAEIDISNGPWNKNAPSMDATPLSTLPKMKVLKADYQPLIQLESLAAAPCLERIECRGAWRYEFMLLKGFSKLCELVLDENGLTSISGISELSQLKFFSAKTNKLRDCTPLAGCSGLIELNLTENDIGEVAPLQTLVGLEKCYLGSNLIGDLEPFRAMKALKVLDLSQNKVTELEALSSLRNLSDLNVRENQIRDLRALRDLYNLNRLGIGGNPVTEDDIDRIARSISLY